MVDFLSIFNLRLLLGVDLVYSTILVVCVVF